MIRKATSPPPEPPPVAPAAAIAVTEPAFSPVIDDSEQITVTDVDFVFAGPVAFSIVLEPQDTMTDQDADGECWERGIRRITKKGETVDINQSQLLYTSTRTRIVTRKKAV